MLIRIRRWISPPVFEGDEDKSRTAILLNSILWFFMAAAGLYGLFAPIEPGLRLRRAIIIVPFVLILLLLKQMAPILNIISHLIHTLF